MADALDHFEFVLLSDGLDWFGEGTNISSYRPVGLGFEPNVLDVEEICNLVVHVRDLLLFHARFPGFSFLRDGPSKSVVNLRLYLYPGRRVIPYWSWLNGAPDLWTGGKEIRDYGSMDAATGSSLFVAFPALADRGVSTDSSREKCALYFVSG